MKSYSVLLGWSPISHVPEGGWDPEKQRVDRGAHCSDASTSQGRLKTCGSHQGLPCHSHGKTRAPLTYSLTNCCQALQAVTQGTKGQLSDTHLTQGQEELLAAQ